MLISVIIPVFNEAKTILSIVKKIREQNLNVEIIIVDDCSNDGTLQLVKSLQKDSDIKVYFHKKNMGKGAAINTGIKHSNGEIIIFQDADLEYDPNDYSKLISPIIQNKADVVYGSRFIGSEAHRVLYFYHRLANQLLTFLSNLLSNINLTDMETCYKSFRASVIKKIKIKEKGFGIEPEITAKIAKLNIRIYEVGISYNGRTYEEGKKIKFSDAIRAVYCIFKYNLFH